MPLWQPDEKKIGVPFSQLLSRDADIYVAFAFRQSAYGRDGRIRFLTLDEETAMSLHRFYRSLFVAFFLSSYVASAAGLTVQHDEESRGERDAIAVAAAADTGPECRVSADCVSDPLRPICNDARCMGCQNDAQCTAERPGTTKCALDDEPGAEVGQCLPCKPYATCSTIQSSGTSIPSTVAMSPLALAQSLFAR
jgi:hypothetical protein